MQTSLKFDAAAAISKGAREYQEDALIADFMSGADLSMAVLADGMGGHAAGDLASKVVVTEVFRELTFKREAIVEGSVEASNVLENAAQRANSVLSRLVAERPEQNGMGATLLGLLIRDTALHWISIGDSPLFLFRDNELQQLNQDHSLATQISFLVESGALTEEEGAAHPERNVLTSVVSGQTIAQIDCPETPFALRPGDILIAASDGLQFLSEGDIARILRDLPLARSRELSDALMANLAALNDPNLDNVTLLTVQVQQADQAQAVPSFASERNAPDTKSRVWPFRKPTGTMRSRGRLSEGAR